VNTTGYDSETIIDITYSTMGDAIVANLTGNVLISGRLAIGNTSAGYPLVVSTNVSGISIYSQGNMSSSGYYSRTEVYDRIKEGSALDKIKDSTTYFSKK
jgi:hypothetical protein